MLGVFIFSLAAFASAILAIAAVTIVIWASTRWPGRLFSSLMLLILSASVGTILLSERVLRLNEDESLIVGSEGDMGSTLLAKLLLVIVIGCSVALCVAWIFTYTRPRHTRFDDRGLCPPTDVISAFMAFYIAFSILPLMFGQRYHFHVSLIYPFFVFLALFLWMQRSSIDPVIVIKQCLGIIVFASLGSAVVAPQLAIQPGYVGLIPGFNLRLWGVTAHANGLGSVASVLLVLEMAEPSAKIWMRRAILVAAATALILAQSKTSLIAASVGLSILFVWRVFSSARAGVSVISTSNRLIATGVMGTLCILVCVTGAWVIFSDTSLIDLLERRLNARAISDLATGTGRTFIWEVAIASGLENPLFGQGLGLWTLDNRLRWGLSGAVHAHNQLLQVFSRSGFVGLITLLVLLYFVFRYSLRSTVSTRGGSIALAGMFLIRAISEVPLQPNAVLGSEFFAMVAFIFYVMDRGSIPIHKARKICTNNQH